MAAGTQLGNMHGARNGRELVEKNHGKLRRQTAKEGSRTSGRMLGKETAGLRWKEVGREPLTELGRDDPGLKKCVPRPKACVPGWRRSCRPVRLKQRQEGKDRPCRRRAVGGFGPS